MSASVGKRVLMLLENNPYPQDIRVRREAQTLTAAGYYVTVICPAGRGQPWCESHQDVRVYRFPAPPAANGFWGYLWEYGYSMMAAFVLSLVVSGREGFDVIHAHNPPDTFVLIAVLYKLLGKRFIFDHHDLSPEMYYARFGGTGNPVVFRILVWLEQLSCRVADRIIATNQSYKVIEMQRGGVPEDRISIVRNGPELNELWSRGPDLTLRRNGATIIAFAGVMGFQDGVDYLLRALHHLKAEIGRTDFFCFLIGGKGDAQPSLKALATSLGLDQHLKFTGWVSDADYVRYIASADIGVDPDPSNPFNDRSTMNKMMEYMALGKPIVAFDLPEHRFTASDAAVYVQPNDEGEFAKALVQLMDDPSRRYAMGAYGRRRIETELAWCHSQQSLLQVYRALFPNAKTEGDVPLWAIRRTSEKANE